ncbi:MAG: DUF1294 domain-containing protein [Pseudomonas sp.]|uniref:DUF1294 domain-containing protein n=1 Tax=Pseudomonas sp. TaxID=306 RepID=UPI002733BFFD|nr:DUF1294 domain-containing protein [Pseudomonas sp.]MDP3847890.1 DUF1294 domain-containing protein [Pseudomonas sp.]
MAPREPAHGRHRLLQRTAPVQHLRFKLLLFAGLCALPLYGATQLWLSYGVVWPLAAYGLFSLVSFAQYWHDKARARQGNWRTPESTLQLTALLGGWPGALLAQQVFRHKTRKLAFQLPFWLLVLVHQGLWSYWLFADGPLVGAKLLRLLAY